MSLSLLSYTELVSMVECGVIDAPLEHVNGTSIDIRIGRDILIEKDFGRAIDLSDKEDCNLNFDEYRMDEGGFYLKPGQFILATSIETFNLPPHISAEFKLKSTPARCGLNHMLAGWCDPWWKNSKLTMEFKNNTQYHELILKPGIKIGQMVFWRSQPVPEDMGYAKKGQYNNQSTVTASKGIK